MGFEIKPRTIDGFHPPFRVFSTLRRLLYLRIVRISFWKEEISGIVIYYPLRVPLKMYY